MKETSGQNRQMCFFCYIPDLDYESLNKVNRIAYCPVSVGLLIQIYLIG